MPSPTLLQAGHGGTLIIIGEDYGEGSSIMQERSHPFAMKSQVWLLDPRPNLPTIVKAVEDGFELSEVSHTPVMLEVRIRACHVHGRFITKDNKKPSFTLREALENPRRDTERVVLPPASYLHEREKVEQRWPAAVKFIKDASSTNFSAPRTPTSASSCKAACTIRSCARCSSSASPTSMAKPRCRSIA